MTASISTKSLISCGFIILGEIMTIISFALITEFNSAIHDYGEKEE